MNGLADTQVVSSTLTPSTHALASTTQALALAPEAATTSAASSVSAASSASTASSVSAISTGPIAQPVTFHHIAASPVTNTAHGNLFSDYVLVWPTDISLHQATLWFAHLRQDPQGWYSVLAGVAVLAFLLVFVLGSILSRGQRRRAAAEQGLTGVESSRHVPLRQEPLPQASLSQAPLRQVYSRHEPGLSETPVAASVSSSPAAPLRSEARPQPGFTSDSPNTAASDGITQIKQAISSIYSVMPVSADAYDAALAWRPAPAEPTVSPEVIASPEPSAAAEPSTRVEVLSFSMPVVESVPELIQVPVPVQAAAQVVASPVTFAAPAPEPARVFAEPALLGTASAPTAQAAVTLEHVMASLQTQTRLIQNLQQQLKVQSSALLLQGERLLAAEAALAQVDQRQQGLEEERHRLENYDQAIALAGSGVDTDALMEQFGLSASEAELITLLHGKRA